MKKLATIVAMSLFASIASAQTQASMTANLAKVEQGKNIVFGITVKPAPSLQGNVFVGAKSVSGSGADFVASQGIGPDQNSIQLAFTIPLNATTGKWTVTRVFFRPAAPGAQEKTLTAANLPSFEVIEHKAVEPDSAVIEVVK